MTPFVRLRGIVPPPSPFGPRAWRDSDGYNYTADMLKLFQAGGAVTSGRSVEAAA
jgi:hypothetical protein